MTPRHALAESALRFARWPRRTLSSRVIAAVLVFVVLGWRWCRFSGEFLPAFREGHFIVHVTARPEHRSTNRYVSEPEPPEIAGASLCALVAQRVGRAARTTPLVERQRIEVDLKPSLRKSRNIWRGDPKGVGADSRLTVEVNIS